MLDIFVWSMTTQNWVSSYAMTFYICQRKKVDFKAYYKLLKTTEKHFPTNANGKLDQNLVYKIVMQFYSVGILKSTSRCIFSLLVIFVCFVLVQNKPCHVQSGMKKNLTAA